MYNYYFHIEFETDGRILFTIRKNIKGEKRLAKSIASHQDNLDHRRIVINFYVILKSIQHPFQ